MGSAPRSSTGNRTYRSKFEPFPPHITFTEGTFPVTLRSIARFRNLTQRQPDGTPLAPPFSIQIHHGRWGDEKGPREEAQWAGAYGVHHRRGARGRRGIGIVNIFGNQL